MQPDGRRILIVGFGNPLMGDDGAGPAVILRLRDLGLPPGVRAEDGGTDALRLAGLFQGEEEIWLVDAVRGDRPPGCVIRLRHLEVLATPQRHATAHALSLPESLRWLVHSYPELAAVRFQFWGIEVGRIGLAERLSPPVEEAVASLAWELAEVARARCG